MEKKINRLLNIEEVLIPYFGKMVLYIQLGKLEDSKQFVSTLYEEIELETSQLNLKSLCNKELSQLLSSFELLDFYEIYFQNDFSPEVRLSYQIVKEKMLRLREKSLKRNLLNSEKDFYYKALYHFRLVESYMMCNQKYNSNILTIDYIQAFYYIWYSTPGLEIPSDVRITLKDWVTSKNLEEEYKYVEKTFLHHFLKLFLPCIETISLEALKVDYVEMFFKTYISLYLNYYSFREVEEFIRSLLQNEEKINYMLRLVKSFSKSHLSLVRGNLKDYNKID